MSQDVKGHVVLTLKVNRERSQYVSVCEELGVASCGNTVEEAFEAAKDATTVYLQTLDDEGMLEEVLAERGVKVLPGDPPAEDGEVRPTEGTREYVSALPLAIPVPA